MTCRRMLAIAIVFSLGTLAKSLAEEPQNVPAKSTLENVYRGKSLRVWVERAATTQGQARQETVAALIEAVKSDDVGDVVAAADALETIGPDAAAAAPALATKFDHIQPWLRIAAMNAMESIGPAAVPYVVEVFEKGSPSASNRAASVLGSMGPKAKAAIPAVKKAIAAAPADKRAPLEDLLAQIEQTALYAPNASAGMTGGAAKIKAAGESLSGEADADWPQFRGPHRDAICRETGLLKAWPEGGPKLLWQRDGMGRGYSSVAIAGGELFAMGDRPDGSERSQYVLAFDLATRKELWAVRIGPPHDDGPRCTPTIDGECLYALGTDGDLVCLETATGKLRWRKHLVKDFDGKMMSGWKYSESPLVDGAKVVCTPGGIDATIVALDKLTGETVWKCAVPDIGSKGKDGAAYSSPVVAEIGGVRQYLQMIGRGAVGVDAATGRFLWGYNKIATTVANIPSPLARADYVFVTNGYNAGAALLKINRNGDSFNAEEVYTLSGRQFQNHHGGVVLVGDYLYAGSGQNAGEPVCLEFATGKIAWRAKAPERGSAAVLYADGRVLFRYDRGLVTLVDASPEAYRVHGNLQPITAEGPAWSHPVIHDGKLYLRHDDLLLCYDLRP